jgi:hypothetical protein
MFWDEDRYVTRAVAATALTQVGNMLLSSNGFMSNTLAEAGLVT